MLCVQVTGSSRSANVVVSVHTTIKISIILIESHCVVTGIVGDIMELVGLPIWSLYNINKFYITVYEKVHI